MNHTKSINILIAGIGGQGVNSLSITLQNTCIRAGLYCKSAIFKGGAQKRGAIYSMIRVFPKKTPQIGNYGGEIPSADLDVLVALEYNESLRYIKYYNKKTKLIINRNEIAFFSKRYHQDIVNDDATKELKKHFLDLHIADFSKESYKYFNTKRMLNYIMGIQAIRIANLPINESIFREEFVKNISFSMEIINKMKAYEVTKI